MNIIRFDPFTSLHTRQNPPRYKNNMAQTSLWWRFLSAPTLPWSSPIRESTFLAALCLGALIGSVAKKYIYKCLDQNAAKK
jgi:hypothetical protein